jgi:hypothetical protein
VPPTFRKTSGSGRDSSPLRHRRRARIFQGPHIGQGRHHRSLLAPFPAPAECSEFLRRNTCTKARRFRSGFANRGAPRVPEISGDGRAEIAAIAGSGLAPSRPPTRRKTFRQHAHKKAGVFGGDLTPPRHPGVARILSRFATSRAAKMRSELLAQHARRDRRRRSSFATPGHRRCNQILGCTTPRKADVAGSRFATPGHREMRSKFLGARRLERPASPVGICHPPGTARCGQNCWAHHARKALEKAGAAGRDSAPLAPQSRQNSWAQHASKGRRRRSEICQPRATQDAVNS